MATDNFNRANGGLGSDWGNQTTAGGWGAPAITSNAVTGGAAGLGNEAAARWITNTYGAGQYSQVTIHGLGWFGADYLGGASVRGSADQDAARDYYFYIVRDDASSVRTHAVGKVVNGTSTILATTTRATSNGDTLRIEVSGTSITCHHNGTQVTALNVTDSDLSGGQPGILVNGAGAIQVDNWEGDALGGGGGAGLDVPRNLHTFLAVNRAANF